MCHTCSNPKSNKVSKQTDLTQPIQCNRNMAAAIKRTWSTYTTILSGLLHYISPLLRKMLHYVKRKSSLTFKSTILTIKPLASKVRKEKLRSSKLCLAIKRESVFMLTIVPQSLFVL